MMSVNYYCEDDQKKKRLSRMEAEVELAGIKLNMNMLIDSGSTSSFINPRKLPHGISLWIDNFVNGNGDHNALELKKTKLVIKAALSESTLVCAISTPKLTIGDWTGTHEFIFADIRETAILGHDFLSKHNANFDFARDKLTVRDKGVTFNLNYINDIKQDGNEELEPKVVKSILKESEPIETNMFFQRMFSLSNFYTNWQRKSKT